MCRCMCVSSCHFLARRKTYTNWNQRPKSPLQSLSSPPPHTIFNQQKPRHQTWRTRPVPVPPLPLSPSQPTPFALFLDPVAIAIIRVCGSAPRCCYCASRFIWFPFDFRCRHRCCCCQRNTSSSHAGACAVYMNWNCYTGNNPQCIQNACLCVCVSISFATYFDCLAICYRV